MVPKVRTWRRNLNATIRTWATRVLTSHQGLILVRALLIRLSMQVCSRTTRAIRRISILDQVLVRRPIPKISHLYRLLKNSIRNKIRVVVFNSLRFYRITKIWCRVLLSTLIRKMWKWGLQATGINNLRTIVLTMLGSNITHRKMINSSLICPC